MQAKYSARDSIPPETLLLRDRWIGIYVRASGVDIGTLLIWTVLWRTYGQCENYGILTGHKGAVLDIHWSRDSRVVFSASADMMLASWDTESGTRLRRHQGHEEVINSMDVSKRGEEILVSGSDDGYIGVSGYIRLL